MRRTQRHTWFALKRVRSLHQRRMKPSLRRVISHQFVHDNVIDIIHTIVVNRRSLEYRADYNAKVMFALTYSLTGYAKNDHLGRR